MYNGMSRAFFFTHFHFMKEHWSISRKIKFVYLFAGEFDWTIDETNTQPQIQ